MTEVHVKVETEAEEFGIDGSGDYPTVHLVSPPSQGRANHELVRRLSQIFGEEVRIVSGHYSTRKKIAVEAPEKEVNRILEDYPG